MKKILTLLTACLLALLPAMAATGARAESGWAEKLKAADGVIRVEQIDTALSELFTEKYLVTFEQQLDWNDPSKGTFPQRVEVGIRPDAEYNLLETDGYCLPDAYAGPDYLAMDPACEPPRLISCSYVHVEHRFFGGSRPEDMSNDGVKYWEYHTAENAAGDYHRIYTALAPLLEGKWIAYGASRGGQMTNVYGHYYPEDMALYMPYVAPFSEGPEDPRFYPFVHTEIGNAAFGEEKGKALRDLILSFQTELMRNKEALLSSFEAAAAAGGAYRESADPGILYDLTVLEFGVQLWQYQRMPFEELERILSLPQETEADRAAKLQTELQTLVSVQNPSDFSPGMVAWPYYVNAATTYGHYHYDFSFLREALKAEGLEDTLSVTEAAEDGVLFRTVLTEAQLEAFPFDSGFRDAFAESIRTTEAKHLMVFGATDPWISLRIPDTDNPNVRVFIHPTRPHNASISSMPDEMREEAMAVLKEWLGAEE